MGFAVFLEAMSFLRVELKGLEQVVEVLVARLSMFEGHRRGEAEVRRAHEDVELPAVVVRHAVGPLEHDRERFVAPLVLRAARDAQLADVEHAVVREAPRILSDALLDGVAERPGGARSRAREALALDKQAEDRPPRALERRSTSNQATSS